MFLDLKNYLRSHRKRSGLSQSDVAFLLGSQDAAQLSRYEKGHRLPKLQTAIALEAIFGVSVGTLFSGIQIEAGSKISTRMKLLPTRLEQKREAHQETATDARKLLWLDEFVVESNPN